MQLHGVEPPPRERLLTVLHTLLERSGRDTTSASPCDHSILVAEQEGTIVGMCALLFSLSTWSAAPVCEVQDLVVTAEHRRNDIGRGLLETAERIARERGCRRIFLLAESWNLGAHAFYRRLGLAEKTCLDFERSLDPPG
jgi:GNAT superfamily N-acetyltransferase